MLLIREMPFGKYKGRVIADLPGNYLNWFAREGFPKGEIGRLLALMQEIDHNGLSSLLDPLRKKVNGMGRWNGGGTSTPRIEYKVSVNCLRTSCNPGLPSSRLGRCW